MFFTFTVGAAAAEFELSCFSRRFLLFPTMPKLIFSLRPPAPPLPFGGGGPGAASSLASSGGVVVEEFCGGKSEIELCRCSFHLAFLSAAHDRIRGGPLFLFLPSNDPPQATRFIKFSLYMATTGLLGPDLVLSVVKPRVSFDERTISCSSGIGLFTHSPIFIPHRPRNVIISIISKWLMMGRQIPSGLLVIHPVSSFPFLIEEFRGRRLPASSLK